MLAVKDFRDVPEELIAWVLPAGLNLRNMRGANTYPLCQDALRHRQLQSLSLDSLTY